MDLYDESTDGIGNDDSDTEELDDFHMVGSTPRYWILFRRTCPCLANSRSKGLWKKRTLFLFSIVLCLMVVGLVSGLHYSKVMVPRIIRDCERATTFSFDDALGPLSSRGRKDGVPVSFSIRWSSCNNTLIKDSTVQIPIDGLYFLSLSVGSGRNSPVEYSIIDIIENQTITKLTRLSTAHNTSDVLGKNALVKINRGQKLQVTFKGAIFDEGDNLLTSWGGFRITDMFSPLSLVSCTLTKPQTHLGPVIFNEVNINNTVGATQFIPTTGTFSAVEDGVYFFSFTIGIPAHKRLNVTLNINDVPMVTVYRGGNFTNGTDTLDRSVLVKLSKGDKVTLNLGKGQIFSSPDGKETTFFGFLYNSFNNTGHCWSAFLDHSWISRNDGSLNPIPIKNVTVNEGDLFNTQNSTVTIKVAGVYYVYASVGLQPGHKGYVRIMHNDEIVGSVARFEGYQNGEDQIGRGALVRAEVGDTLHLWEDACPGCAIKADGKHRQTSFLGFLVHERLD